MKHRAALLGSSGGLWATQRRPSYLEQLQAAQQLEQLQAAQQAALDVRCARPGDVVTITDDLFMVAGGEVLKAGGADPTDE